MYKPPEKPDIQELRKEVIIKTSRSGGAGGQHVNKVETKVMLIFYIDDSLVLSDDQKARLHLRLANRIDREGKLIVTVGKERSQLANKKSAFRLFEQMINKAFIHEKVRRKTSPSLTSKKRRLEKKKQHGEKKANRKKIVI